MALWPAPLIMVLKFDFARVACSSPPCSSPPCCPPPLGHLGHSRACNEVVTRAKRAETLAHDKYVGRRLRGNGVSVVSFRARDDGRHGASTATVYLLLAKQLRNSGLPADVLVGKLKKDISFALRRGTTTQVTRALDAAQRTVEDELALDEAGWDR